MQCAMQVRLTCGFQSVEGVELFFHKSTLNKGIALFEGRHVGAVVEIKDDDISGITGRCQPQTKISAPPYQINIILTSERAIDKATCSCRAGVAGQCKHTAAVTIFVNRENTDSVTSKKQKWDQPTMKDLYGKGALISDLFPLNHSSNNVMAKPLSYLNSFQDIKCPLIRIIRAEENDYTIKICKNVLDEIVEKIVIDEQKTLSERILTSILNKKTGFGFHFYEIRGSGNLKIKLNSTNFLSGTAEDQRDFYASKISIPKEAVLSLAIRTTAQSQSKEWRDVRFLRLTSSRCHQIVTRRGNFQNLVTKMLNLKAFRTDATEYGLVMEKTAKQAFAFATSAVLVDVGVVVSDEGWLCASPDSICIVNECLSLLEIKCPFSRKGKSFIDYDKKESFVPYLTSNKNLLELKSNHTYYTQVQVSMYVLKLEMCHFCVYSGKQKVIINIERDDKFLSEFIPKLKWFYFTHFLPAPVNKFK